MSAEEFDYIPDVLIPSNNISALHEKTEKSLSKFGFKYVKELSTLADFVYRYSDLKPLYIANLIHLFLYILDDQIDANQNDLSTVSEKIALLDQCSISLNGKYDINSPQIIKLMHYSLDKLQNQSLKSYIIEQIEGYILGVTRHIGLRNEIVPIGTYMDIRYLDGACEVVWLLAFLDHPNIEEIIEYFRSDEGKHVRMLANTNVSLHNDVTSLEKDKKDGTTFNSIICYMHQYDMSEDEAKALVIGICNRSYRELVEIGKTNEHTNKLAYWCKQSLGWHLIVKRNKKSD